MAKKASTILFLAMAVFCLFNLMCPGDVSALWAKRFDNNGWSELGGISPAQSGGYYLWGTTSDPSEPYITRKSYLLLSRLDASGNVLWVNRISTGNYDRLSIGELGGNNWFIQGTTSLTQGGDADTLWAKFTLSPATGAMTPIFQKIFRGSGDDSLGFSINEDGTIGTASGETTSFYDPADQNMLITQIDSSTGNIQWSRVLQHGPKDRVNNLLPVTGGYLLCATVENTSSAGEDILVAKLNSTGVPEWAKLYGGNGINSVTLREISGAYYLLGTAKSTDPLDFNTDIILIKIDGSGNYVWGKRYASPNDGMDTANGINEAGSFIVTGSIFDTANFNSRLLVMKLNSDGTINWQKSLTRGVSENGSFIRMDDGSYLLTGSSTPSAYTPSDSDVLFGKYDSNFNPLWVRTFGGTGTDMGGIFSVANQYMITGETDSFSGGGQGVMDIFGITLNSNGTFPDCQYCQDVTLTEGDPGITLSDLDWPQKGTDTTSNLLMIGHSITLDNIALQIDTTTLTAADICTGTAEDYLSVTPPENLASSGTQGGPFSPSNRVYTLQNSGASPIDWTASKSQGWVTLSAVSGTLSPGATTQVTVSINGNANDLTPNIYGDTVTFTNSTNGNGTTTRGISLTVNATQGVPDNFNDNSKDPAKWGTDEVKGHGHLNETSGRLEYTCGSGTAGDSSDRPWILARFPYDADWAIQVNATNNTSPGGDQYSSFGINVRSARDQGNEIEVELEAYPGGSNGFLAEFHYQGALNSFAEQLTTSKSAPIRISFNSATKIFTTSYHDGNQWLAFGTFGVNGSGGVSGNADWGLGVTDQFVAYLFGYSEKMVVNDGQLYGDNFLATGGVKAQGGLSVTTAEDLISTGFEGGPFTSLTKDYILMNTGAASIKWSAAKTQAWVKLSKASGTLAPGASVTVTVTIQKGANAFEAGAFNDTITFTNNTDGIGSTARSVKLTVNPVLLALSSPANEVTFTACSCYSPAGPPAFSWTTSGGTLKKLELWFSRQGDFSGSPVKVKGPTTSTNLQITASTWQKILPLPGPTGGIVYWKAVATKGNSKTGESEVRSFHVEGPVAAGSAMLSHTSNTDPNPPVLSWQNNCNIKHKVLFYNDPDFYTNPTKSGVKKSTISFSVTNPNDNGGVFGKALSSSQWTATKKLGSPVYWHIESSDVIKRSVKTGPMSFPITP